jgi:hypothetical protein
VHAESDKAERRALRTFTWFTGAAVGAAVFLGLLHSGWGEQVPVWAGIVAVVGTLLCGDLSERSVRRLRRVPTR